VKVSVFAQLLKHLAALNARAAEQIQAVEEVRNSEERLPLAQKPGIGYVLRTLARVRNLGKAAAAQSALNQTLVHQLETATQLLAQLDAPTSAPMHFVPPDPSYAIKHGYTARVQPESFMPLHNTEVIHQPDVYEFAAYLARQFGCTHIIDLGCGVRDKLANLHPEFQIIGIDLPAVIAHCKHNFSFGQWIEHDFDTVEPLFLDPNVITNAVVICADVIEHLCFPEHLLAAIHSLLNSAPIALISTPERDLVRGYQDYGPPANQHHAREWNLREFETLLLTCGFNLEFIGLTFNNSVSRKKHTILAVLANHQRPKRQPAPTEFEVVAIMKTYNEADIIAPVLHHLISGGIKVYLIDNWSTDATVEIARSFLGRGLIQIEQFPPEGRDGTYHWNPMLQRTEEVALELNANWYIHHDADEYRESPWENLNLRDGLYHADQCGFNAVDFTLVNFQPVDDNFVSGSDFVSYFPYWEFGRRVGHFQQIKAWKNTGQRVNLTDTNGHLVSFHGRRVYPYKFLLRHYTFRTQEQAYRKMHQERIKHPTEQGKMSLHYEVLRIQENYLRDQRELNLFEETFYSNYLVERLSGIGILPRDTSGKVSSATNLNTFVRPNLFIVGAPRCGTSAMRSYLMQHPDIYFPDQIEMNFFGQDIQWVEAILRRYPRTLEGYLAQFTPSGSPRYVGDKTPWYLYSQKAAGEIKRFNPDAKIVVMLRNPADMLYSLYAHVRHYNQNAAATFEEALELVSPSKAGAVGFSNHLTRDYARYREIVRFGTQLQRYFDQFGRERVHVMIYDDLQNDTAAAYKALLQYLGVDDTFQPDFPVVNSRSAELSTMLPSTRQYLQNLFKDEIDQLGSMLNRDLSHWYR
jgi:hypothetical protein